MEQNMPSDEALGRFRDEAAELLQLENRAPSDTEKSPG